MSNPHQFFSTVKERATEQLCKWGLYLELHRGTYTTQAQVGGVFSVETQDANKARTSLTLNRRHCMYDLVSM